MLCASVGNKRGFSIVDARCNHEVYWVRVFVALGIQHAMRMRHITICSRPLSTKFSALSDKRRHFRKKKLNTKCMFEFSLHLLSEAFLILRRNERGMIKKNVSWSSCKVSFILVRLWWNLNFLDGVPKNLQISNFMKIRLVGADLFRADKRTNMTKLIVVFAILRTLLKMGKPLSVLPNFHNHITMFCQRSATFKQLIR